MKHKSSRIDLKVTTLGDNCGIKTHVFQTLINFYDPSTRKRRCTFIANRLLPIKVDETDVNLTLIDTSGLERYANMHSLMYGDSMNCVILCFDLESQSEYHNAITHWLNASRRMCPSGCHFILCGVQSTLSRTNGFSVSHDRILNDIRDLPIAFYRHVQFEENVVDMFTDIVRLCKGENLKLQGYLPDRWVSITNQQKEYLGRITNVDEVRSRVRIYYLKKPYRWPWSNHVWINQCDMQRIRPKSLRQILTILSNEEDLALCLDLITVICGFLELPTCLNIDKDKALVATDFLSPQSSPSFI